MENVTNNYEQIVIFSKIKPCIPSDDGLFSFIQITALCGSPTLALYQSLSQIFPPFLKKVM
ncbi:hypothetical protein NQ314_021245 [Rhamnusium bicolor]|uniref:Uncharacterized protein n=1 Tax=Rhamnusium bicolor TaxID=1586634 RepID=A0AAV8WKY4_9CUCU|nr:hypothetical protein NQ314_021245 [Rhamnusium bicolor]